MKILQNVISLLYSTVLSRVLLAVTLIILAQYLNAEQYGMFSVALAFSMVMGFFTDAGVSNTVIREGSKNNANVVNIISSYIKLRLLLLFGTFMVCVLIVELIYKQEELREVLYFMIVPMITGLAMQNIGITYFQLVEKMHFAGLIRIWTSVCCVVLIGIGMYMNLNVSLIACLFGASYVFGGIYSVWVLVKHTNINLGTGFERALLHQLSPFILSGLLMMLLPQLGPLVLEKTLPLYYVGLFAIAYRVPSALYQVPGVVAGAFYPVLFKYWNAGEYEKHLKLNITQIKVMALMGIFLTIPLFHLSAEIVQFLFGKEWLSAAEPLRIISLVLFLQSISFALADGLTTKGLQTNRTVIQMVSVVLGITMYYFFSLHLGIQGASYAVILIESFTILFFWLYNPSRMAIGKQVLAVYLVFGIGSILLMHHLLSHIPLLASALNTFLIIVLAMLDREVRYAIRTRLMQKNNEKQINRGFSI